MDRTRAKRYSAFHDWGGWYSVALVCGLALILWPAQRAYGWIPVILVVLALAAKIIFFVLGTLAYRHSLEKRDHE